MSEARRNLEKRARNAILQEAFFRWESALTVAGALVAAVALPALWWVFVALGAALELVIGIGTMRNPAINAKAVSTIFRREFQPQQIKSTQLRQKTGKALQYLRRIEESVGQTKEGVLRDRLKRTTEEVVDWVEAIYRLASRIDRYDRNKLIARDMQSVPQMIDDLSQRRAKEPDPAMRQQLDQTIADRKRQLANLGTLKDTMERAELQLERTLSALGTVYSQLLVLDTKGESAGRAKRLQEEISEQVHQLQDITVAMDEVYQE